MVCQDIIIVIIIIMKTFKVPLTGPQQHHTIQFQSITEKDSVTSKN